MSNPYSKNNRCSCGKIICNSSVLCNKCFKDKSKSKIVLPKCRLCDKILSKSSFYKKVTICKDCSRRKYAKNYCRICKKELVRRESIHCRKCSGKIRSGENHHNWKNGISKSIGNCIYCGKKLKLYTAISCKSCWQSGKRSKWYGKQRHLATYVYKNFLMRSSWEVKYAEYLDNLNVKWIYEPKTFAFLLNNKHVTYTPDFYLPKTDEYIEIKGYWYKNSKEKIQTFVNCYPNIKITILQQKELKNLKVISYE